MDPKEIQKLAKVLRDQGDKLLTSEFKFTVTGELLRALNDSFSLIIDEHEYIGAQQFQVTKPNYSKSNVFRELMFIYDFIQKTLVLRITKFIDDEPLDESCMVDISKFRNLTTLEIQRVPIKLIKGLQSLRMQLQELVAEKCLTNVKDLLTHCAGDNCSGFMWNNLKRVDFSYNNLERIDSSFEFTPYLQHLNLSHNKIVQISALVWLPNLKILNLSYNQLTTIPKLNTESMRRLQVFNLSDNLIEDISGIVRLEALISLDLSGNCLLDHALLLPLCTLSSLRLLNLSGNPLAFHPKHRVATCRYLSKNAASIQFHLDGESLSKHEKSLTGNYENYFPLFGHRMQVPNSSSSTRVSSSNLNHHHTPTTKSVSNTPDNTSLNSNHSSSLILNQSNELASQKKLKARDVVIEDRENKSPTEKRRILREGSKDHLETKREIEQMREQYGNEWLYKGYEPPSSAARRRLELGDILSESPALRMDESFEQNEPLETSTPQETTMLGDAINDKTFYESMNTVTTSNSAYASALDDTFTTDQDKEDDYVISDPEENEVQFIVVDEATKDDLFLTLSEATIKEKDAMTGRTLTKWGITTLQSVERVRSNIIHLSFDTIRKDKRERVYKMDPKCCQDLEKILRDYLSSRSFSDMNQTVYKCIKCNSQFCREIDERKKNKNVDVRCPSCGNQFVIEIQNKNVKSSPPKPLSVFLTGTALSTIAGKSTSKDIEKKQSDDDSIEIPKTNHSFSSIESAFDSNQSVAGSSVEVLSECSSHISHASQQSQSSIEVIDPFGSRKPSEERRIITAPSLDTIDDDHGTKHDENVLETTLVDEKKPVVEETNGKTVLGNTNLTESSSSGESVQTAYEQNGKKKNEEEKPKSSPLESIFKTSSILLSKTVKKEPEPTVALHTKPMQYNFDDLSILDHRLKLYCFQHVLEDNDEKVMWLIKCVVVEEDVTCTPRVSLLIMSTKKIYVLRIIEEESEEISSWLQKSPVSNFLSNIEKIQELPFQNGLSFIMKNTTNFHVLLRDENLLNVLEKHIVTSNQTLEIIKEPSKAIDDCLLVITKNNQLRYLSIFTCCKISLSSSSETSTDSVETTPIKTLSYGTMVVTKEAIHLLTNFKWLCEKYDQNWEILTQPITNLVELENLTNSSFTLIFMNELENTIEKWRFSYDSYSRICRELYEIDDIWKQIFSLSLLPDEQL